MPWKPITSIEDLVACLNNPGFHFKTCDLDWDGVRLEIAVDVAAFANAFGGSIVVGLPDREPNLVPCRVHGRCH
jgi:hypothetical protein